MYAIIVILTVAILQLRNGMLVYCQYKELVNGFGELVWKTRYRKTYLQFDSVGIIECARNCLVRKRCLSFNYSDGLKFCELNYERKTPKSTAVSDNKFVYSDVTTWPKELAGRCQNNKCENNEACSHRSGECKISDCGPVDFKIPENTILEHHGNHEVGNGVGLKCKDGFFIYNEGQEDRQVREYVVCNDNGQWENVSFSCQAHNTGTGPISGTVTCDENKILIDVNSNATPRNKNKYTVLCNHGYSAYKYNGARINGDIVVKCNSKGQWTGTDFYCKNTETLARDFCRTGYTYDESGNICYKVYNQMLNHTDAQKQCREDYAHLVTIVSDQIHDFVKTYSVMTHSEYHVDGIWKTSGDWFGWANQKLLYNKSRLAGADFNGTGCVTIKNAALTASSCYTLRPFICQFEVCPESAGYRFDRQWDLCYRNTPRSIYHTDMCTLYNNDEQPYSEFPYIAKLMASDTARKKELLVDLLNHTDENMKGRIAFLDLTHARKLNNAKQECYKQKMEIVKLNTTDKRELVAEFASQKNSWIGLQLSKSLTYDYRFLDDTKFTLFDKISVSNTDKNKCVVIAKRSVPLLSVDCLSRRRFTCAPNSNNYSKSDIDSSTVSKSFDDAVKSCESKNKTLVQFTPETMDEVTEYFNDKPSYSYIGMKLQGRNYTYTWTDGEIGTDLVFGVKYTNTMKDSHQGVVINSQTKMFQLSKLSQRHPAICETPNDVIWVGDASGKEKLTIDENFVARLVTGKNILSYICRINTNTVIQKLQLYRRKGIVTGT